MQVFIFARYDYAMSLRGRDIWMQLSMRLSITSTRFIFNYVSPVRMRGIYICLFDG